MPWMPPGMARDPAARRFQHLVEELLVTAALVERSQPEPQQAGEVDSGEAAQGSAADEGAQLGIRDAGDHDREHLGGAIGDQRRIVGYRQPARRHPGEIGTPQPVGDRCRFQKVRFDEAGQAAGDPVLVSRYNGRMRDRQTERPAEQCHHGEPVGNAARQRRLGDVLGEQRPEARLGIEEGGGEEGCGHEQQAGRDQLLAAAIPRLGGVGRFFGMVGHRITLA